MQIQWQLLILLGICFFKGSDANKLPLQVDTDGNYDFKTTLAIVGNQFHTSCKLCSGGDLTMVYCAD